MAVSGDVELNTQGYFIEEFKAEDGHMYKLRRYSIEQEADKFSSIGNQTPESIISSTQVKYPPPIYGGGRRIILPDKDGKINLRDFQRFWHVKVNTDGDGGVMTHWASQMSLALLDEDSTETALEVIRGSATFKGNLWTHWEYGTSTYIKARKYVGSTTSWDAGGDIQAAASISVALDLIAHKTHLISLHAGIVGGAGNDHNIERSTDGATWAAASTDIATDLLTNAVTANENIDAGLLAEMENLVIAIVWHEANGTITFYDSADAGNVWIDRAGDIASNNGPQGVAVMINPEGNQRLIVGTTEGLYEVDTSVNPYTHNIIWKAPISHKDNFRRMVVHTDGALWFGLGVNDDTPAPVGRLFIEDGHWKIDINERFDSNGRPLDIYLGPAAGDTCDISLHGPIRWWKSAGNLIFASIGGGAASRNGWIMVHNGRGWHVMWQNATQNQKIEWIDVSSDDDGTPRLHFSVRTAADNSDSRFLAKPCSNPNDGQAYKFQLDGQIDRPEYDLDMPRYNKAWLNAYVSQLDFSAATTDEYENLAYGVNGAAPSTNWGDFLSGTLELKLASGAGVAGRSLQPRQSLFRGTTEANTPKDRGLQIDVLALIPDIQGFEFVINIDETADKTGESLKTIVDAIGTARDNSVLNAFIYADISTLYVRVKPGLTFLDKFNGEISSDDAAMRGGKCRIRVEQVIG